MKSTILFISCLLISFQSFSTVLITNPTYDEMFGKKGYFEYATASGNPFYHMALEPWDATDGGKYKKAQIWRGGNRCGSIAFYENPNGGRMDYIFKDWSPKANQSGSGTTCQFNHQTPKIWVLSVPACARQDMDLKSPLISANEIKDAQVAARGIDLEPLGSGNRFAYSRCLPLPQGVTTRDYDKPDMIDIFNGNKPNQDDTNLENAHVIKSELVEEPLPFGVDDTTKDEVQLKLYMSNGLIYRIIVDPDIQ